MSFRVSKRMNKLLFAGIAVVCLCAAAVLVLSSKDGIYELDLSAVQLSGDSTCDWEFIYIYNADTVRSGYRFTPSSDTMTLSHNIQVFVRENGGNTYSGTISIEPRHGFSGKTEIAVTDPRGRSASFEVTCRVKLVGLQ